MDWREADSPLQTIEGEPFKPSLEHTVSLSLFSSPSGPVCQVWCKDTEVQRSLLLFLFSLSLVLKTSISPPVSLSVSHWLFYPMFRVSTPRERERDRFTRPPTSAEGPGIGTEMEKGVSFILISNLTCY